MSKSFHEYTAVGRQRPEGRDVKNREDRKLDAIRTTVRMPEYLHQQLERRVDDGTFRNRSEAIRFGCLLTLLYFD